MDEFRGVPLQPTDPELPTMEELEEEVERYYREVERRLRGRERKLWKARNRMPMHAKHLLRNNRRRQRRRRSEHIIEE